MPQHMWGEMWAPQRDRTPELRVVPSYSISRINKIDKTDGAGALRCGRCLLPKKEVPRVIIVRVLNLWVRNMQLTVKAGPRIVAEDALDNRHNQRFVLTGSPVFAATGAGDAIA